MTIREYLKREFGAEDVTELWTSHGSTNNSKPYEWVWKANPWDDELYADERMWITDIFEPKTTQYTEDRDRYPKFAPRRNNQQNRREELQVGDTTQLDSFLADFVKHEATDG